MRSIGKPLLFLVDVVIFLLLLGGASNIWIMAHPNEFVPSGPDDIGSVQITVKSLNAVSSTGYEIFAEEVPTKFILGTLPPTFEKIKSVVRVGDRVNLRIKKELIDHLQGLSIVLAYGISLEGRTNVLDVSQHIPKHTGLGFSVLDIIFYMMVGIPALYFLRRIFSRKRANSHSI
jgi:hypothetical protein